jgi:alanine racemase
MAWHSRIAMVRELSRGTTIGYGKRFTCPRTMRVATLPAGYADGFARCSGEVGPAYVLVSGTRCPIVGRVSMDMITIDVSHLPDVQVGHQVTLMGQDGEEQLTADAIAGRTATISHEVLCSVGNNSKVRLTLSQNGSLSWLGDAA